MKGGANMNFKNLIRRIISFRDSIEDHMEAVAFAEEGFHDIAKEVIEHKVMMVSVVDKFSDNLIDYTVKFAERLNYGVVALNVLPVETKTIDSDIYCEFCNDFKRKCKKNVEKLRCACEERNIHFCHVVKYGKLDKFINDIHKEVPHIDYICTEPEGMRDTVPVFCVPH